MAFFLIVPSVMIVSVVLIHKLANRLRLQIHYTTLVATAVLSFMVNIAATMITPDVGRVFLLRLGLMIFIAASLLTMANQFLIKQQRKAEEDFKDEVKAAYEADKTSSFFGGTPEPSDSFDWHAETSLTKYNESTDATTVKEEITEPVKDDAPDSETVKPVKDDTPVSETVKPVKDEATVIKPPKEFPLEKVFKPLAEVKPEELEKLNDAEEKPEPEEKFPLEEVFQPLPELKPEEVEVPKETSKPEDDFPLQEVFQPLSTLKLEKLDSLPAEEVAPPEESEEAETLDDILDKAYKERTKGHVWQAIELYKKALERYRNDEYAPFVTIDLGNIYKEQALYSKAIKIFEEALALPAVTRNEDIKKEFVNNLEYLRVVRDVLLKYHALSIPFGKLSKEILQEIDAEYQKAQRRSEQFK